jgi:hypothetical protein
VQDFRQAFVVGTATLFMTSSPLFAKELLLKEASTLFLNGQFKQITASERPRNPETLYLVGLAYARQSQFKAALQIYKELKPLTQKFSSLKDLSYEMAQAHYALNELELARADFFRSYQAGVKKAPSLYYLGHISQMLEEHDKARRSYLELSQLSDVSPELLQPALLGMADSMLRLNEEKKLYDPESVIIPVLERAIKVNPQSSAGLDAQKKLFEVQDQNGLNPLKFKNGRPLPGQPLLAYVSHKVTYDDNITLATGVPTTLATRKDSFVFKTNAFISRTFPVKRRLSIAPEINFDHNQHSDRQSSAVFENDSYSFTPAIRNIFETNLFGKKAGIIVDLDYNYTARDYQKIHKKKFFSRFFQLSLGQRFSIFDTGDTTWRFKYKIFNGYQKTLDNKNYSFSIDQVAFVGGSTMVIGLFQYDALRAEVKNNSTDSYLFRVDAIIPEVANHYNVSFGMATTFLDTKAQKATRGLEKTLNPSLKIFKRPIPSIKVTLGYDFTKNISKDKTNLDYKKHALSWEIRYDF